MFCYQCEQTAKGQGCNMKVGVCGKDEQTAVMQDLLVEITKKLAFEVKKNSTTNLNPKVIDYIYDSLFTTVTNVNFNVNNIKNLFLHGIELIKEQKPISMITKSGINLSLIKNDLESLINEGLKCSIDKNKEKYGEDLISLQEILIYGLKGMAAYAHHAKALGKEDKKVAEYFVEALSYINEENNDANTLLNLILKCGEINLLVMELLDNGNTERFGHPEPTKVCVTHKKGKCILVSGHELLDLEELLKQTEGKDINVYTHGEMLPAHGYPKLKKYKHLAGNFGGAWQDQAREFAAFPGSILMTTNCIQKPLDNYKARIFTSGLVEWPEVDHINNRDFSKVIESALKAPGFSEDGENKEIMVGFARNAILSVAGTVVEAVKNGNIKHFFLVGGCDGAKSGRNYYTEFAEKVPKDSVILTLACGKYRFNKLEFGDIGGIPRLLDCGQCNDAYSAIQIAIKLAEAFNCGVNDLPLSLILSWYEQKAVCILLTLLYLGIKNIKLGPTVPAFISKNVLNILVEKFNIQPIKTPDEDLKEILG